MTQTDFSPLLPSVEDDVRFSALPHDHLISAYQNKSKYLLHWLELKYTHKLLLNCHDYKLSTRHLANAILRECRKDYQFKEYCRIEYGHELLCTSSKRKNGDVFFKLSSPNKFY
jgi:hypothetical protein